MSLFSRNLSLITRWESLSPRRSWHYYLHLCLRRKPMLSLRSPLDWKRFSFVVCDNWFLGKGIDFKNSQKGERYPGTSSSPSVRRRKWLRSSSSIWLDGSSLWMGPRDVFQQNNGLDRRARRYNSESNNSNRRNLSRGISLPWPLLLVGQKRSKTHWRCIIIRQDGRSTRES